MTVVLEDTEQGRQLGESALLGRARSVMRRTARDLKDALAYTRQLEECAHRCYVAADQEINDDITNSVAGLLRDVREKYPNQELEVVIFGAPDEARGGEHVKQGDGPGLRRD